mmetsp:Transcript_39587/g.79945  ORF Transcript_39587/g.79945 Transcript_39587/m.79945 type:complete len:159 (-) Transcript_39587:177-653(-)
MPKFALRVKCELDNVGKITWNPDNQWALLVQHPQTQERCEAYFCLGDDMELTGSRGTANFIKKWDGEQTQSYLKMIDVKKVTGATEITDSDQWVTLFAIECRGLEPVKWMPKEDFNVTSGEGAEFKEVEFEDGFWAEYDAEHDAQISIQNLEHEFVTV